MRRRIIQPTWLLLFALIGCVEDPPVADGRVDCSEKTDCPPGQSCFDGTCFPVRDLATAIDASPLDTSDVALDEVGVPMDRGAGPSGDAATPDAGMSADLGGADAAVDVDRDVVPLDGAVVLDAGPRPDRGMLDDMALPPDLGPPVPDAGPLVECQYDQDPDGVRPSEETRAFLRALVLERDDYVFLAEHAHAPAMVGDEACPNDGAARVQFLEGLPLPEACAEPRPDGELPVPECENRHLTVDLRAHPAGAGPIGLLVIEARADIPEGLPFYPADGREPWCHLPYGLVGFTQQLDGSHLLLLEADVLEAEGADAPMLLSYDRPDGAGFTGENHVLGTAFNRQDSIRFTVAMLSATFDDNGTMRRDVWVWLRYSRANRPESIQRFIFSNWPLESIGTLAELIIGRLPGNAFEGCDPRGLDGVFDRTSIPGAAYDVSFFWKRVR